MKRGMMIQLGLGALALTGMIALAPAFADDATTKPSKDSTLSGPKPDKSSPKGKDFGGGPKKEGQGNQIEKKLKELGLTADQETKIKEIMKSFNDKMNQFHAENKVKMDELKTQMDQAKAAGDKSKMDALMDQKKGMEKGAPKKQELISQISDVLTPEQREKFRAAVDEQMKGMNAGKGDKDGPKEPKHMKGEGKGAGEHKKHEKGGKDQLKL